MTLTAVLIFAAFALALALLAPRTFIGKIRSPLLLIVSVLAIYWLQPALPIRGLDFWLPTATLLIAVLGWLLTSEREQRSLQSTWPTVAIIGGAVLVLAASRFFLKAGILTPSRPPQLYWVALALIVFAGSFLLLARSQSRKPWVYTLMAIGLIAFFVVLKFPQLTLWASQALRSLAGQKAELATATDLRWLGFSYIAFRLIHTLRDRQMGRLSGASLQEYLIYMLFFPAFTAGPIDRVERFIKDLRAPYASIAADLGEGGERLVVGLFKKFVLADALSMLALSAQTAAQVHSAGYLWLMVYAYAFMIFFDFSGYTDIAIGLGRWLGIRLPENFNHPYLKPNLTQFWNNWHITLTTWFRSYFFNPFTRALRGAKKPLPIPLVILITQLSTMLLIGLWHGMTLNFVFWGLWHGLGMFIHNRWAEFMKPRSAAIEAKPALQKALTLLSTFFTFNYVALGWVWFALPSIDLSLRVLGGLFGAAL